MRNNFIRVLIATGLLFTSSAIAGSDNNAQKSANKLAGYLVDQNYLGVAELTHPAVVEATGGSQAIAQLLKNSFDESGIKITSMTFSAPRQTIDVNGLLLAVFPYNSVMIYQNEHVEVNSLYIGFSKNSKKWYFIDCEGVTQELLGQLAPGYKNNLRLEGC